MQIVMRFTVGADGRLPREAYDALGGRVQLAGWTDGVLVQTRTGVALACAGDMIALYMDGKLGVLNSEPTKGKQTDG